MLLLYKMLFCKYVNEMNLSLLSLQKDLYILYLYILVGFLKRTVFAVSQMCQK